MNEEAGRVVVVVGGGGGGGLVSVVAAHVRDKGVEVQGVAGNGKCLLDHRPRTGP